MSLFFFVGWISLIFLSQPYYPFIANYFFLRFLSSQSPFLFSYCCFSQVHVTKNRGTTKFLHIKMSTTKNMVHNQQNQKFWWLEHIHKFNLMGVRLFWSFSHEHPLIAFSKTKWFVSINFHHQIKLLKPWNA
jgi:hypothetical protein